MQIYINGSFLPAHEPCITAQDRGWRLGDGVFETIAVHNGRPYQWEFHLSRLEGGLRALRIACDTSPLLSALTELLRRNGSPAQGFARIGISRGAGSKGYLPDFAARPTVIMEILPAREFPGTPLTLHISTYEKIPPRALPVHCKTAQGLNSTLARLEAADHGADEALLLNAQGEICEASGANIFWLENGNLHTPSLECGVLQGSTRAALLRLYPGRIFQGRHTVEALRAAQAVFLTSVSLQIAPVSAIPALKLKWDSVAQAQQLREILQADIRRQTLG